MGKTRTTVPKAAEKRAFQQAASHCGFCPETEVAALQIHHTAPGSTRAAGVYIVDVRPKLLEVQGKSR